ncbi:DinB family protein [Fulvivirga lutimaris]|uniref:DinB family protein n=1 Tax=Fulvivirga lutimaris TaxID=1819566 RepID=UPI0012BCC722|nr:DinB family protein [Fulvivirga lutimaris]MTI39412.1 hypothetical protein [Fulvivirga lutimaris]
MKTPLTAFFLILISTSFVNGQTNNLKAPEPPQWTEADKQYLLDNLMHSKQDLIAETKDLTEAQWNFKESAKHWSINQIVEHLGLYELIFDNDIAIALQMGPFPKHTYYAPDSVFMDQDPQDKQKNKTTDFTKPFSYSVPMGNNRGIDNLTWVIKMRQEAIDFVKLEDRNLRIYYVNFGPNIHQKCIQIYSHSDRHLRQIKRIKANVNFPR